MQTIEIMRAPRRIADAIRDLAAEAAQQPVEFFATDIGAAVAAVLEAAVASTHTVPFKSADSVVVPLHPRS